MSSEFYVVGGTLQSEAPSYVVRRADRELFESLSDGDFCYVLTPRQMGKSSLMIRIADRLREEGTLVAILDLTAVGQNLGPEQWYGGLLSQIGHQLEIEDELIDFWTENERLSPLQRWMTALVDIVLRKCEDRLVIFVDEIDTVRNLPFSTDEFFAGIRELYNQRARDIELNRLAFCLLGVATPSDLIRDTRTTPFNIGRRIELSDFTEEEAKPLREGLSRDDETASRLLRRILYWTGGHPYLTQRFCSAVAGDAHGTADVDRLCERLFLSTDARNLDDNLLFVRERILRSEVDLAGLLDLYRQVLKGKRVPDDEANPLVDILRLSGITRAVDGRLSVRNRIYRHVFDRKWIEAAMPDAELQRQRAAYRRGLFRATTAAAVILIALSGLSIAAFLARRDALEQGEIARREKVNADLQRNRAEVERIRAEEALRRVEDEARAKEAALAEAESQNLTNRRLLYADQMNQARQAFESNNIARVNELLANQGPELRGFEWYYLWRLCHNELRTLPFPTSADLGTISADGGTALVAGTDGAILLWDPLGRRPRLRTAPRGPRLVSLAMSSDKRRLATGHEDGSVRIIDPAMRDRERVVSVLIEPVTALAFSADGGRLAAGGDEGALALLDVSREGRPRSFQGHTHPVRALAFSPDGRLLASGAGDQTLRVWDVESRKEIYSGLDHSDDVTAVTFSPDGRMLASGSQDGTLNFWDARTGARRFERREHAGAVNVLVFSHRGALLATGSTDASVRLWRTSGQPISSRKGHTATVLSVAFTDDDSKLLSVSRDNSVKTWDVGASAEPFFGEHSGRITSLNFSPNGKWLATTSSDRTVRLWTVATGREVKRLAGDGHRDGVNASVFTPDGRWLVTGSQDRTLKFWDPVSGRLIQTFDVGGPVNSITASSDGRKLAVGLDDGRILFWSIADRRETGRLVGHEDTVTGLDFSPDGRLLISGSIDGTVRVWSVPGRSLVRSLNAHRSLVNSLSFSPDGRRFLTGSEDGTAKLWETGSYAKITLQDEIEKPVTAVNFSPDGKRIIIGHNDGSVEFWDVLTMQPVFDFREHTGRIYATAFSPDGTWFATGSFDQTWKMFHAASPREVSNWR